MVTFVSITVLTKSPRSAARPSRAVCSYVAEPGILMQRTYFQCRVDCANALDVQIVSRTAPGAGRYHSPEVDFVQNGRNGLLVDSPDPDTLARAVLTVASDNTFGRNALAFAHSNLHIEHMVDGLEKSVRFLEESDLRTTLVV